MNDEEISRPQIRSANGACVVCGRAELVTVQKHRIGGLAVTLCRHCYQRLTDQRTPPFPPVWTPPDDLESIAQALLAEADLMSMLAQSRWLFAHVLIARVRAEVPDQEEPTTSSLNTEELE